MAEVLPRIFGNRLLELVGLRTKVGLLGEDYEYVLKSRDFTEDPTRGNSGDRVRLRKASPPVFYAPRGRDSSYFGLYSTLRAVWWCFCHKGLFGQILECGNAALF